MKPCKHPNLSILEVGNAHTRHVWEAGKWVRTEIEYDEFIGRLEVDCPDCGLQRAYNNCTRPKWIDRRLDEIGADMQAEE